MEKRLFWLHMIRILQGMQKELLRYQTGGFLNEKKTI